MRVRMDDPDGRHHQYLMVFRCPHCQRALEQTGQFNRFACLPCRKMYDVRIELIELDPVTDGDTRKRELPGADPGGG